MRKEMTAAASRSRLLKSTAFAAASAAVLAIVVATTSVAPAAAQAPQCGARQAMIDRLASKYGEHPVSLGVTATGSLLEVLASAAGTWTILVTVPGGPTCLVSAGEGWRDLPLQVAEDPAV